MQAVSELMIPVPWGHIAAKAWGFPNKPQVLAIHGLHDNAASFDQLVPHMSDQLYVVCVDLPGHGLSSHFPPGLCFSLLDYVSALKRVTDHLQWSHFSLLAHSFGGHIAIYFAVLFGPLVIRTVLIDMYFAHIIPEDDFILVRCQDVIDKHFKIESKRKLYEYKHTIKKLWEDRMTKLDIHIIKALQKRAFRETVGGYIHNNDHRLKLLPYPLFTQNFHFSLIKNINCKLLVISTSEFEQFLLVPLTKATIDELKIKLGKKMKVVRVKGCHDIHMDQPQVVTPIINKFILEQECRL